MKPRLMLPLVVLLCLPAVMAKAQADPPTEAEYRLQQGIQEYKGYRYEAAVEHFRLAHKLDPQSREAALYLATALSQMYVPGVDTPDNLKWATEAIETYQEVLALDLQNLIALKSIGYLNMQMRKYPEAKSSYGQASQADPNDPEAFYSVGVIDWVQAYKRRMEERTKHGLSMIGPSSIAQPFCARLRADNLPLIEDGMQALKRAMELRADYDDAMAYMSLLLHERADVECHDKPAAAEDQRQANEWVDKVMDAKKRNATKATETESHQPPSDLVAPPTPPAPPPPPPPPKKKL